jgi:hypothetical protein
MSIEELEAWFQTAPKPEMPVYLNGATKVVDYELFVQSHIYPLKMNANTKVSEPIMDRLLQMKLLIEANL